MACTYPIQAYRAPGGGITFSRSQGFTDMPFKISCGKCTKCGLEYSRQLAIRSLHEGKMSWEEGDWYKVPRASFVTFTYDDDHLPQTGTLVPNHWRNFAKKLRREYGPFRFLHCGEYGEKKQRPHLHASIWGIDFRDDRKPVATAKGGETLYFSPKLDSCWQRGEHFISEFTFSTAAYVARYIMKKQTGETAKAEYGERIDLTRGELGTIHAEMGHLLHPPYCSMSLRPGLGKTWIDKYMDEVYPADEVIINGHQTRPPKYYDLQYEKINPVGYRLLKLRRAKNSERYADDQTYWRLEAAAVIQESKMQKIMTERT